MADKRISQLVDRGTVANNDVVPIVVSGASTTNKATISSIQTFMQGNLDLGVTSVGITIGSAGTNVNVTGSPITSSGNITINIPTASAANRGLLNSADWNTFNSKLDSVGLIMPSAFIVTNSPLTSNGSISVAGAGTVSQYIRGDGSLADFPSGGGGGGASVSYYLNGSVSQGTIGGIAYREINRTPILGAGTDITIAADGYIASFITDAGDPALLEIPAGNWNFESYFSASSGGGSPSFYIELYKVNSGGTATLIASNSATPELISFGTSISPYFSPLAVPTTVLTVTDRLAVRYYVTHSGRTITLHTENSHLCQIITTFTTGLTALNGLTAQVQNFATGTSGTNFGISSSVSTHTFNLPTASATNRGALSSADWSTFNNKQNALNGTGFVKISGTSISYDNSTYLTTSSASSTYLPLVGGTLTGNLNGTTASFENGVNLARTSGNVGIGIDAGSEKLEVFSGSSRLVQKFRTSTNGLTTTYASANATVGFIGNGLGLFSTATETQFGIRSESDLLLGAGGGVRLTIAAAGEATFSSSVTTGATSTLKATGNSFTNGSLILKNSDGTLNTYLTNAAGGFYLSNNGTTANLSILSTGAATFSSSVTANSTVTSTTAFGGTFKASDGTNEVRFGSYFNTIGAGNSYDGVIYTTSASSGLFILTGGSTTPKMTITSSGNVGIGTASPQSWTRLEVAGTAGAQTDAAQQLLIAAPTTTVGHGAGLRFNAASGAKEAVGIVGIVNEASGNLGAMTFHTYGGGANIPERMRITSTGNVGIGTASPTGQSADNRALQIYGAGSANRAQIHFVNSVTGEGTSDGTFIGIDFSKDFYLNNCEGATIFENSGTERMRIRSDGTILAGTTDDGFFNGSVQGTGLYGSNGFIAASRGSATCAFFNRYTSTGDIVQLRYAGSNVGSISYNGTITQYNSTSDYRLKEDLQDFNGLEIVSKLKTYDFNWKDADVRDYGMIAHELQKVLPSYVNGEKDEVDEEGKIKPQGVDYSKIVPILIKAIQELKTEIDSLKNQMQ